MTSIFIVHLLLRVQAALWHVSRLDREPAQEASAFDAVAGRAASGLDAWREVIGIDRPEACARRCTCRHVPLGDVEWCSAVGDHIDAGDRADDVAVALQENL